MPRSPRRPRFEIWQVGSRIHSEDNPVRLKVLRLLEARPRRLTELVALTGKAKSTLSALHIPPLVQAGLIDESADASDARAKIYRLEGHRLGSSDVEAPKLRDAVISYVQSQGALPLPLVLGVVAPQDLVASGASAAYVEAVARRIGQTLGRSLTESKPDGVVAELSRILSGAGLGTLETVGEAISVRPRDPKLGRFLEALASEALSVRLGRPLAIRSRK